VVLNAAAAISVAALAHNFERGMQIAEESIDSGAALGKLEALREASNS
jgi:anthranilate phosphoribosyltransferase